MWVLLRRFDRIILVAAFALEDAPCFQTFGRWLGQSMIHLSSWQICTSLLPGKSFCGTKENVSCRWISVLFLASVTSLKPLVWSGPFHRSSRKGSPMEPHGAPGTQLDPKGCRAPCFWRSRFMPCSYENQWLYLLPGTTVVLIVSRLSHGGRNCWCSSIMYQGQP